MEGEIFRTLPVFLFWTKRPSLVFLTTLLNNDISNLILLVKNIIFSEHPMVLSPNTRHLGCVIMFNTSNTIDMQPHFLATRCPNSLEEFIIDQNSSSK